MHLTVKNIIPIFLIFLFNMGGISYAQIVDKVCPSIPYGNYGVKGSLTSAYFWNVLGGQIIQSNGKDSISVHWDFAQPKFALSVVEISISGCVGDTIFAEVTKGIDPAIYVVGSDSLCVGNSTLLTAYGGIDYYWSTGQHNQTISSVILYDSSFFVIGNDGCGFDTSFYNVKAMPLPTADFSFAPTEVVEFQNIIFTYTGNGASNFNWYFDNSLHNNDISEVTHSFNGAGYHRVFLYVESDFQCSDTVSKNLLVQKSRTNSFTPNNDGANDFWEIDELKDYPNCEVWIFDRSGAEVFNSRGYAEPWDGMLNGQPLPIGSYYYIINFGDGNQLSKGVITILR